MLKLPLSYQCLLPAQVLLQTSYGHLPPMFTTAFRSPTEGATASCLLNSTACTVVLGADNIVI